MTNKTTAKGFTLIEMLVTVAIFTSLIILASSSLVMGYVAGSPLSVTQKRINRDMENITETLRMKFLAANDYVSLGGNRVFGFKTITDGSKNILVIATNPNPAAVPAAAPQCTYFGWDSASADKQLKILQEACGGGAPNTNLALYSPLSSNNVKVIAFNFSDSRNYDSLPQTTIDLEIQDAAGRNVTNLTYTFYLTYEAMANMCQTRVGIGPPAQPWVNCLAEVPVE